VTWQPGPASDEEESPADRAELGNAGQAAHAVMAAAEPAVEAGGYPQLPPAARRGRSWAAMVAVLAIGLCGLAGGAAGAVRQLLPRDFSAAEQHQIQTWEMTRRWRAMPAGQIFPLTERYQVQGGLLNSTHGLWLTARRLGIAPPSSCAGAVSRAAAAVLASGRCTAVLRATYLDASGSMVITVGVAALPTPTAAMAASERLTGALRNQGLALHAFPLARSAAAGFRQAQRQFSIAEPAGPYVVLATAGFTDGRRHVALSTDDYLEVEMSSLAYGLAGNVSRRLDAPPPAPVCPGAPGC
jgi:hypothetical protein